jgi:hypothetical protein
VTRRPSLLLWLVLSPVPGLAEYRITRDHGGDLEQCKAAYARWRDAKEQVIIDGICNSACTLVLGMFPSSVFAPPREGASGFMKPISTSGGRQVFE